MKFNNAIAEKLLNYARDNDVMSLDKMRDIFRHYEAGDALHEAIIEPADDAIMWLIDNETIDSASVKLSSGIYGLFSIMARLRPFDDRLVQFLVNHPNIDSGPFQELILDYVNDSLYNNALSESLQHHIEYLTFFNTQNLKLSCYHFTAQLINNLNLTTRCVFPHQLSYHHFEPDGDHWAEPDRIWFSERIDTSDNLFEGEFLTVARQLKCNNLWRVSHDHLVGNTVYTLWETNGSDDDVMLATASYFGK